MVTKPSLPQDIKTITVTDFIEDKGNVINRPPFVLYCKGNTDLFYEAFDYGVSIIGSREATPNGVGMAQKLAKHCAEKNYPVVCPLCPGIAEQAIATSLSNNGKPIVFLSSGFDNIYPPSMKELAELVAEKGLLITEYPPDVKINQKNIAARNRIIGALPKATIIVEAKKHSGTLITAAFALNAGRDVGVVPQQVNPEDACNEMIRDGAFPVIDETDIDLMLSKGGDEAWKN